MAIKNYTTTIKIEKTIAEVEEKLAKFGANQIFKLYKEGIPKGLAFTLEIQGSPVPFKLPMREENILQIFKKEVSKGNLPRRYASDIEQARRTGWRIIKDWIESQLALIEIEFAKPEEIFLPYMYNSKNDETFFETIEKKGFTNLLE